MNKQIVYDRSVPFKYSRGGYVGNTGKMRKLPSYLRYPIPNFTHDKIEIKIVATHDSKDTHVICSAAAPRVSLEECDYAKTSPC